MYRLARFLEFLAFVLEDIAERINLQGTQDEAEKQTRVNRSNLV